MRRIIFSLLLFLFTNGIAFSQFSGTNCTQATKLGVSLTQLDEYFACFGATGNIELTYTYNLPTTFKWYKYKNFSEWQKIQNNSAVPFTENNNLTTTSTIYPDVNFGYAVKFDGKIKYCWLADINDSPMTIGDVTPNKGASACYTTNLNILFPKLTKLSYVNSAGTTKELPRILTVKYNTLEWNEKSSTYAESEVQVDREILVDSTTFSTLDSITKVIEVPSPYLPSKFIVSGDKLLTALGQNQSSAPSVVFTPVAVVQHLTGSISEREYQNEIDKNTANLTGSAPLMVEFKSNTNYPICQHFEWYITSKEDSKYSAYYTDADLRYTFKNTGLYTVKLVASSAECSSVDSTTVTVIESSLEVPNVFTPNGDGKNDEFRVAYKSLIKFEGVVYNRWGRVVYRWSDPGKGWDGRINGRMALPGPYYYIIEAEGSDIDPDTNKPRKYKKKGDINLLRGK